MSNLIGIEIPDALIDSTFCFDGMLPDGYGEDELFGAGATRFPDKFRFDRQQYADKIRENEKHKAFAGDFSGRTTHQGNSHECVSHATIQAYECVYNRQLGQNRKLFFSPVALYTRTTSGRQWGGSNVMTALNEGMNDGLLPEHDGAEWMGGKGGQAKRFKATVHQTAGRSEDHWPTKGWIRESQFPDRWEDTARHFRILEAFTIPDANAHISALLHGWTIVNGRDGHSICHAWAVIDSRGRVLSKYRDSYHRDLFDSENKLGGGYAIRSVTAPDDPARPAGSDMKENAT